VTTTVGVIADTHCPEFLERLPARVPVAFRNAELILHAGDVDGGSTLEELSQIAPVQAVRGDHDRDLGDLPATRELTVEGLRIVVVHGNRSRWIEEPQTLLWTLSLGLFRPHSGLPRSLRRRFPHADAIIYGHTHRPDIQRVEGALLFNPGGVHQWNPVSARRRLKQKPGWFEWCWLQVARHLIRYESPTVGVLMIDADGIMPRIIGL